MVSARGDLLPTLRKYFYFHKLGDMTGIYQTDVGVLSDVPAHTVSLPQGKVLPESPSCV